MSTEFNIPKEQQTRFDSKRAFENRQIRIFLSSTFSDMQEERDALVKTFNSLKLEANKRNVTLSVVDLRWGVTEEEARTGKVISVCLNEIEHSHPFFIGMLGSRYGYAPDLSEIDKNPDLKERYPWIKKAIEEKLSITEMEMLYGALCNDDIIDAVFYFKQSDKPDDNPKLTALKNKIVSQQRFPHDSYASVDELCEKVKTAVLQMLDSHFPVTETTPLDKERTAQRAYINSRHAYYVKRQSDYDRIDAFLASDDRNLVVTGDSGLGKSALLANWIKQHDTKGEHHLIYHFVGNSLSASNSYTNVLRHLCDEIYDLYPIEKSQNPNKAVKDEAEETFGMVASQDKPLVIVIDGINQILSLSDEKQLIWLPKANSKIQFIFSTLNGDETMTTFKRMGYTIYELQPLTPELRREFATKYLESVGKHLTEAQWQRIFNDEQNKNTLVLKTLLDELICFGTHEKIDERIDYYLNARTIPEFYDRVLQRMEDDYSNGEDLVGHALTLIAYSENGLSEDEIVGITGCRTIDWNLFYCAAYNHLVEKEGLISFAHQYMLQAVNHRYPRGKELSEYRKEMIDYFKEQQALASDTNSLERINMELAYQYYMMHDWPNLYDTLVNKFSFDILYRKNPYLLRVYWSSLMKEDKEKYPISAYLDLEMKDKERYWLNYNIARFLGQYFYGDPELHEIELELYGRTVDFCKNDIEKAMTYNALSSAYMDLYKDKIGSKGLKMALVYLKKALKIAKANLSDNAVKTIYDNMGMYYSAYMPLPTYFHKARRCMRKALKISKKAFGEESTKTGMVYMNLGNLYLKVQNPAFRTKRRRQALEFFLKAEKAIEKDGADTITNTVLYQMIGIAYDLNHDYKAALPYYQKVYDMYVKVMGEEKAEIILERISKQEELEARNQQK